MIKKLSTWFMDDLISYMKVLLSSTVVLILKFIQKYFHAKNVLFFATITLSNLVFIVRIVKFANSKHKTDLKHFCNFLIVINVPSERN